jgi:hypothetical protein
MLDEHDLIPNKVRRRLGQEAFDFGWWEEEGIWEYGDMEKGRERTRDGSVFIDVVAPDEISVNSMNSFVPFIQLMVGEEEELRNRNCTKSDFDKIRKEINDFFRGKAA